VVLHGIAPCAGRNGQEFHRGLEPGYSQIGPAIEAANIKSQMSCATKVEAAS